ncbi:MAG TPA: cysteine desulfurase family protein [Bacillota bacterium]|nr:cysteine desulfurase family protein [Bacillota bacterium]
MIYLDNSATTKPHEAVLKSFQKVSDKYYANPSSIHPFGGESEELLRHARIQAATLLQVQPEEIVFTSGGTEGNNLAIKGIALKHHGRGKHIITSVVEHPSVLKACKSLEEFGFDITYLPVNGDGIVSLSDLKKAIRTDTILVSIMHVNNELGSIQPITDIEGIIKNYPKIFFHVDNVQGFGKVPISLKNGGIDLCTLSGHKIHGLKGTGLLYIKKGTTLYPLLHGGNQERAYRSGTENIAGAVSLVKAIRLALEQQEKKEGHLYRLQTYAKKNIQDMPYVEWNTPENSAPHIINVSAIGLKPEIIIHTLAEKGIQISTKSACSSKELKESSVLMHSGFSRERAASALRISMSHETTQAEIDECLLALKESVHQLKEVLE